MGIYSNLKQKFRCCLLDSLMDKEIAAISKSGYTKFGSSEYENIIKYVLMEDSRYKNYQYVGNKNICCDLIVDDVIENKKIAIQLKSATISNHGLKIYEMASIAPLLKDSMNAKEVLSVIIHKYNERIQKERIEFQFNEIQDIVLIKCKQSSLLVFENVLNLEELSTDISTYEILEYKPKDKLKFKINNQVYIFKFCNHTLKLQFKADNRYIDSIRNSKLESVDSKTRRIVKKNLRQPNTKREDITLDMKFKLAKTKEEIANLVSNCPPIVYAKEDTRYLGDSYIKYVKKDNNVYVVKDSIIKETCVLYEELLNLNVISKKGRVLKDLQFNNEKSVKKYINRKARMKS